MVFRMVAGLPVRRGALRRSRWARPLGGADDGAGWLAEARLLEGAVAAEDPDADIVHFEVERHAARAVGELDHLAGLDLVEGADAGAAVPPRPHPGDPRSR